MLKTLREADLRLHRVPIQAQILELLRGDKVRLLEVDNESSLSQHPEGHFHIQPALFLQTPDDQNVVEVEDDADAHRPEEGRYQLGEFGEDEWGRG